MAFRYLLESLTEQELLRIDGSTPLGQLLAHGLRDRQTAVPWVW